jgi:hypothetical protein
MASSVVMGLIANCTRAYILDYGCACCSRNIRANARIHKQRVCLLVFINLSHLEEKGTKS